MADGLTQKSLTRFVNTVNVISNMDLTKEAAEIKCPMLVLGSNGDKVLGAEASTQIAEITDGELYLYGEEYPHADIRLIRKKELQNESIAVLPQRL